MQIMCTKGKRGQVSIDTLDGRLIDPQSTLNRYSMNGPLTPQLILDHHSIDINHRQSAESRLILDQFI